MKGGGIPGNAGGANGWAPSIGCRMFMGCLRIKAGCISGSVASSPASLAHLLELALKVTSRCAAVCRVTSVQSQKLREA